MHPNMHLPFAESIQRFQAPSEADASADGSVCLPKLPSRVERNRPMTLTRRYSSRWTSSGPILISQYSGGELTQFEGENPGACSLGRRWINSGACKPRDRGGCFTGLLIRKTTARKQKVYQVKRTGWQVRNGKSGQRTGNRSRNAATSRSKADARASSD